MGVITLLSALIAFRFEEPHSKQPSIIQVVQPRIQLCTLIRVKRVSLSILNYCFVVVALLILEPILSLKLSSDYSFSPLQISASFAFLFVANVIGTSICLLLPQKLDKRRIILATNFTLIVGLLLTGPSRLLRFPDKPAVLLTGLGVTGFSVGVSQTLSVVEAVSGGVSHFPS